MIIIIITITIIIIIIIIIIITIIIIIIIIKIIIIIIINYIYIYSRRKFRSKTSDNMDRWKAEQGRGREKRKIRREKIRRERVRRKKIQMREKVGKSRFTLFFQWFVAQEGRKVGCRLAKAAGVEPAGQMRDEQIAPSQNVQNTPPSLH